jgi:hypothetical protein
LQSLWAANVTCLAYFITLSEPLTFKHQTGLVNWIRHKKTPVDYAVSFWQLNGVIQENFKISGQQKTAPNDSKHSLTSSYW